MEEVKNFLKDELLQLDVKTHPKVVGKYTLDREGVYNQIVDWILHYLENRKCPYHLAVTVAKQTAQEMDASIVKQTQETENFDAEKVLNSWDLYQEAIKKLPTMCNSFLEQGKEEMLSSCVAPYTASIFAIKNKRRKMEDRHVIHHDLNMLLDLKDMPSHSYYAVFDGHSGVDAASYASAHLHVNIAKHPAFLTDTPKAISEAYKVTDENFLKHCTMEENIKSGSTAVCAIIRERTIYLSWLGDSQAVLVKEGKPVIVTNPHNSDRQDEQKRIQDLGGHVTQRGGIWRVNGVLAVTRALGDPDHKPFVSNEPDMTTIHLDGTEDFLILACDGLWDGMSPEDVTTALYYNLSESALEEPLEAVAAKLVHQSKLQGSEDNITAIVVFLRDITAIKEYATKLTQESSSQLNFLGMNGEGRVFGENKDLNNMPCAKPTILELNAASTKKLKNTANVLSSTGIADPSYSYPGNAIEGISYQNISTDNSIFIHHENVSCLPPEATALSELPTPPIDDILASQQFEKLSSDVLYQELNAVTSGSLSDSMAADSENPVQISNPGFVDYMQESSIGIAVDSKNTFPPNDITPDEAMGIASCVVSNTIETAVKCLSSSELSPVTPVCSQKLNPYAEPFVMKSFIPDDTDPQNESSNNTNLELSLEEENIISKEPDNFEKDKAELSIDQNVVKAVMLDKESNSEENAAKENIFSGSTESDLLRTKLDNENYTLNEPIVMPNEIEMNNMNQNLIITGDQISSDNVKDETNIIDVLAPLESNLKKADIEACQLVDTEAYQLNFQVENLNTSTTKDVLLDQSLISLAHVPSEEQNLIPPLNIIENVSPIEQKELNLENCVMKSDLEEQKEVMCKAELDDKITKMANIHEPISEPIQNVLAINASSTVSSQDIQLEVDKSVPPDSTSVILESVTKDSLTLINVKDEALPKAAILPADQADECHIELSFAVDLQTVPDGVPEAEGVTEDVDSDSEKDGGWSYMKGNTVGNAKLKSNEPISKSEKLTSKTDTSKVKKDNEKPVLDKNKIKNLTSIDKSKKPVSEKKPIDVKERKTTKTVSSTLPKTPADKGKTTSTSMVSRIKKDAPPTTKVTTVPSTKSIPVTKPSIRLTATTKNTTAPKKPMQPISTKAESSHNAQQTKPTGNSSVASNTKPKPALSTNGTKTNVRPGSASTLLSKGQPSNQSIKSNAMRSTTLNRPAASTVSSKVVHKPMVLTKPASTESKPRPIASTMKKVVPSTLKKSDIKETKDIVNKQISARSNATIGTLNKNVAVKTTTISNKHSTIVGNKTMATKTHAPVKNDVAKKEVPKPQISKLSPKSNVLPKMSTKREVTKSTNIQGKKAEKKTNLASGDAEKASEVTQVCEDEKFILEVIDKEVILKEQEATNSVQVLIPVENGTAENIKPVEDVLAANSALENLL